MEENTKMLMTFDTSTLSSYPLAPGVYLMKDASGTVIYVGKAKSLRVRIRQYFAKSRDSREMVPYLTSKVSSIETIITEDEKDALLLENTLIKRHKPKYNALLKDDKTYINLMINYKHKWPMIRLVRYKGKPKADGLYFGPYTNAFSARQTLKLMQKIFPLRQCSDNELSSRIRPCLLHGMKRCVAPCVDLCSKTDYDALVRKAIKFLKGEDTTINNKLKKDMEKAAEALEFEKAQEILETLKQLEYVQKYGTSLTRSRTENLDSLYLERKADLIVIAKLEFRLSKLIGSDHFTFKNVLQPTEEVLESFLMQHYSYKEQLPKKILIQKELSSKTTLEELLFETSKTKVSLEHPLKGERKKILQLTKKNAKAILSQEEQLLSETEDLLLELQETLKLTRCPLKIECFDTSSHGGKDLVAAMVCFVEGKPSKTHYRKYTIKTVDKADDYSALKEAIYRRYSKLTSDELPDLVMVDGGKGQLGVLEKVFEELKIANIDYISLAKEKALHTKGLTEEKVYIPNSKDPIKLPKHSPLLFFLQTIRDETHRYVISFHRKKERKKLTTSELDHIKGIGAIKKKRLLSHFKSVDQIKKATLDELKQVPGLTQKDIEALKNL